MSGPNHVAGGFVLTGIYLSMWDVNIYAQPHFIFFTAFFSLLPDIDHTRSIIGKAFYPIAKYLDKKFGHRTITHSLLCYFLLALTIGIIERTWCDSRIVTTIFLWSYASHLILDMLTIQGVPLLYPFRKNPCVIPGNPKFRLRSSELKTESLAFVLFIMLSFSCKDLFANGFWNTYDKVLGSLKSIHAERLLTDKAIEVQYHISRNGNHIQGKGLLVSSTPTEAVLFDKGFIKIKNEDRIIDLVPIRINSKAHLLQIQFAEVSFDSLQRLIQNKPILSLHIQSSLPIHFIKENQPQSSTNFSLTHIFNPVLKSSNIDSLDEGIAKEISLVELELQAETQKRQLYHQHKSMSQNNLLQVQAKLQSEDLAVREKAIKELSQAQSQWQALTPPLDKRPALRIRMNFLKTRLRIHKEQKVNGFISYLVMS